MNNKDRIIRLSKYADDLKSRLQSPVPPKHVGHPETFRQFLNRELTAVTAKIEGLKASDMASGGK